eukprot:11530-Amphidinium_carterae.1
MHIRGLDLLSFCVLVRILAGQCSKTWHTKCSHLTSAHAPEACGLRCRCALRAGSPARYGTRWDQKRIAPLSKKVHGAGLPPLQKRLGTALASCSP